MMIVLFWVNVYSMDALIIAIFFGRTDKLKIWAWGLCKLPYKRTSNYIKLRKGYEQSEKISQDM